MTKRADIFSASNLEALPSQSPSLQLFQKREWAEYLELIARIYDLIEEEGTKVDFDRARSEIDAFYAKRGHGAVEQKRVEFVRMTIAELGVLKDSHDGSGRRYVEGTREGKSLLRICEGLILNRRTFTGAGAETLLAALNGLLSASATMTADEAIETHRQKIRALQEDIQKIKEGGLSASDLISPGASVEELYSQAEEAASQIIAAAEDVKASVEEARRTLVGRYRDREFSAGRAIQFVADFHSELRLKPEFSSFSRARDLFSYIDGLGGKFEHKDVTKLWHRIRDEKLVDSNLLCSGSLAGFTARFHAAVRAVEEKVREQVAILRAQVHYVLLGEGKRVQSELRELMGILVAHESCTTAFLERQGYSINQGMEIEAGPVRHHSFEIEETRPMAEVRFSALADAEMLAALEALRKADEATISRVIERLKKVLSRRGKVLLSEYPFEDGIIEFYVLCCIEHFSRDVTSEPLAIAPIEIDAGGKRFMIGDVRDRRLSFVC